MVYSFMYGFQHLSQKTMVFRLLFCKVIFSSMLILSVISTSVGQFTVSNNQRYLEKNGASFFWLGDTAWELFHRLNKEQADFYLKRRAEQGFTVIQAVVLAEFDGLHTPNAYGDLPLIGDKLDKPNEKYFRHVDDVLDLAHKYGLTIALLPTWGDKVWKASWGAGPEIFNPINAESYGFWLAERYKNRPNIVWVLGGDRNPQNANHLEIWHKMANGIKKAYGANKQLVMSFHPQPNEKGAAEWFNNADWLSFNMFQNGHCRDTQNYDKIFASYQSVPTRPVIDAEPIYEDHPVCFNPTDLGTSNAYDVRKYAYLDLFAGAFGHTYGCHDIWQFYSPNYESVNHPHVYWQEAMELPGANQMKFVRNLMESRPMQDRIPNQGILVEKNNVSAERIQATSGNDYIFVYSAAGKSFTINFEKFAIKKWTTFWYNPRTGKGTEPSDFSTVYEWSKKFTPPTSGYGQDWVLVIDEYGKNYLQFR